MAHKRVRLANPFVSLEAEVAENEFSEGEGSDEDDSLQGFIDNESHENELPVTGAILHPIHGSNTRGHGDDEEDEDELIRQILEHTRLRTQRSRNTVAGSSIESESGSTVVRQWLVPVQIGKEKQAIAHLEGFMNEDLVNHSYQHVRLYSYKGLSGRIYMDVAGKAELKVLLNGAGLSRSISRASVVQDISGSGYEALRHLTNTDSPPPQEWTVGQWVRIKSQSLYKGDIALITKTSDSSDIVSLVVIPRIPPSAWPPLPTLRNLRKQKSNVPGSHSSGSITSPAIPESPFTILGQKRRAGREPPALPDCQSQLKLLQLKDGFRMLPGRKGRKLYPNGLEYLSSYGLHFLNSASPSKEEVYQFLSSEVAREIMEAEYSNLQKILESMESEETQPEELDETSSMETHIQGLDEILSIQAKLEELAQVLPGAVYNWFYTLAEKGWHEREHFLVTGLTDYDGFIGQAYSIDQDNKFLSLESLTDSGLVLEVEFKDVAPLRYVGDWVKVAAGPHEGEEGMIMLVSGQGRDALVTIQPKNTLESLRERERIVAGKEEVQFYKEVWAEGTLIQMVSGPYKERMGEIVSEDAGWSKNVSQRTGITYTIDLYPAGFTPFTCRNGCLEALQDWTSSAKALPAGGVSTSGIKETAEMLALREEREKEKEKEREAQRQRKQYTQMPEPKKIEPHSFIGQEVLVFKGQMKGMFGILKDVGSIDAGVEVIGAAIQKYQRFKLEMLIPSKQPDKSLIGATIPKAYTGSFFHIRPPTPPRHSTPIPEPSSFLPGDCSVWSTHSYFDHFLFQLQENIACFEGKLRHVLVRLEPSFLLGGYTGRKGWTNKQIFPDGRPGNNLQIFCKSTKNSSDIVQGMAELRDLMPWPPGAGSAKGNGLEVLVLKGIHKWRIGRVQRWSRKEVTLEFWVEEPGQARTKVAHKYPAAEWEDSLTVITDNDPSVE